MAEARVSRVSHLGQARKNLLGKFVEDVRSARGTSPLEVHDRAPALIFKVASSA
jgi:hypothetical protein